MFNFDTRPISEDEIIHLKEHRYTAISDQQNLIDDKLQAEVGLHKNSASERAGEIIVPLFFFVLLKDNGRFNSKVITLPRL